jgi:hypothetical protein
MLFNSVFKVKNFFIEKVMVVFSLMVLFGLSVFFIYIIMQKGFNLSILKSVLITVAYFILFSSLPFTGFLSFYIFILIFFNSYNHFDVEDQRDWGNNYVNPYEQSGTYYHWLQEQGFKTVRPDSQHYGADGQAAWSKFLLPWLTSKESSSIITNTVNPA